jgi:hypothetical protein
MGNLTHEMFHHERHLVSNGVFMEVNEKFEQVGSFVAIIPRVIFNLLQEIPVRGVGRVVFQDIEDVLLFNGLTHAVDAERGIASIGTPCAKEFQGFLFRCSSEGKGTHMGQMPAFLHFSNKTIFEVVSLFVTC